MGQGLAGDSTVIGGRALRARPVLYPTVFYAVGPTGIAVLERAVAKIAGALGGIPPFFAFLSIDTEGDRFSASLQVGEHPGRTKPLPKVVEDPIAEAERLLLFAVSRVTEFSTHLEDGAFGDYQTISERLELVAVTALEEVTDFHFVSDVFQSIGSSFPSCWRLGFFLEALVDDESASELRTKRERVAQNLAALDACQTDSDGVVRNNGFEASFLLGSPVSRGQRHVRRGDAIEVTASFLNDYSNSTLGRAFREVLIPQPGPTRFYLGMSEREFDGQCLARSLEDLFWEHFGSLLDDSDDLASVTPEIHVPPLHPQTVDEAATPSSMEDAVMEYARVLSRAAAGFGHGPDGVTPIHRGMLARGEALLAKHLERVRRLRHQWAREKDELYRRFKQWDVSRKPLKEWVSTERVVEKRPRLRLLWWLLVPLGIFVGSSSDAALGWSALGVLLVMLSLFVFPRRTTKNRSTGIQRNPEYDRHMAEGERLKQRWELAVQLVGGTRDENEATGLLRLDFMLTRCHLRVKELCQAISQRMELARIRDPRTFVSEAALQSLLEATLASRAPGARREDLFWEGVGHALRPERVLAVLEGDAQELVREIQALSDSLFQEDELTPARTFRRIDASRGNASRSERDFFQSLVRGTALLIETAAEDVSGEYRFLVHGDAWEDDVVRRSARSMGECRTRHSPEAGRIAVWRVARGRSWD